MILEFASPPPAPSERFRLDALCECCCATGAIRSDKKSELIEGDC